MLRATDSNTFAASGPEPASAKTCVLGEISLHTNESNGPAPEIPGYEILGRLGEGGMGVVYRARQTALKRMVALKMISAEHVSSTTQRRFQLEAETVARLHHSGIVQIFEVGEHGGRPYLALELVEGATLATYLKVRGPLPVRDAALLTASLAKAMHHAHGQGVLHRDLKPSNILLQYGELAGAKVSDFGLAKLLDTDTSRTRSGAILGTPTYMSPEQARGDREVGPGADIWALGVILYECLTCRPPFHGASSWDVLWQAVHADPAPPRKFRPELARDLETICLKALAKNPAMRYPDASAFADDLEKFAAGEAISARPEAPLARIARRLKRRPMSIAMGIVVVGAAVLLGLTWQARRADAASALSRGQTLAKAGAYTEAQACFLSGQERIHGLPGCQSLAGELQREWVALELRHLAQQLRFRFDATEMDPQDVQRLLDHCTRIWSVRELLWPLDSPERPLRDDLLDIGLLEMQLRRQLDPKPERDRARLNELDSLFGVTPVTAYERNPKDLPPVQPRTAAECRQLGRAMMQHGRAADAAILFDRGLELDPTAVGLHFDRARCAMVRHQPDVAITAYTACLAISPRTAVAWSRRGDAYLARSELAGRSQAEITGDRAAARSDYRHALELDPTLAEASFGQARIARIQRDWPLALSSLNDAIKNGFSPARGHLNLAVVQYEAGRLDEARVNVRRALELQPDLLEARDLMDRIATPTPEKTP